MQMWGKSSELSESHILICHRGEHLSLSLTPAPITCRPLGRMGRAMCITGARNHGLVVWNLYSAPGLAQKKCWQLKKELH